MRRSIAVLFWIMLGAIAAGGSTGYFLYQANLDRLSLINEARAAQNQIAEAQQKAQQVIKEANEKIALAQAEIEQAQATLRRYEEAQALIASTPVLPKPAQAQLKTWPETVAIDLGISIKTPPKSKVVSTNKVLAALMPQDNSQKTEAQWLAVLAYDEALEKDWLNKITETTPITYSVNDRLLTGIKGKLMHTQDTFYVFRVASTQANTHLIWARPVTGLNEQKVLDTLATLTFK